MMKPTKTISILDIKTALKDPAFIAKLPESLAPEIEKIKANPSCGCNAKLYEKILHEAGNIVAEYFPEKTAPTEEELNQQKEEQAAMAAQAEEARRSQEQAQQAQALNNWSVINCGIHELESKLKSLAQGRKQITLSRYEDQVTVVINNLG